MYIKEIIIITLLCTFPELYKGDENYANCTAATWNPIGNGMAFRDFPFPIIAMGNQTEISFLITEVPWLN